MLNKDKRKVIKAIEKLVLGQPYLVIIAKHDGEQITTDVKFKGESGQVVKMLTASIDYTGTLLEESLEGKE